MPKAPKEILEIRHSNPAPPIDFAGAGAAEIALGKDKPTGLVGGPFPSVDARQEWKQVLAPEEDYEVDLVGVSGWVLGPHTSTADLPFSHPFGFDWEFMLAVDDDPSFTSLLARGNQVREQDDPGIVNRAINLQIPVPEGKDGAPSLLGVEIDGGLVPNAFSDSSNVAEGDRMAVFGRWIVDCGHAVTVPVPNPGDATYRSEIHPPLLLASARVNQQKIATGSTAGPPVTRVLFTSRPYLTGQHYTTDPNNAYSDVDPASDGPFVDHIVNEIIKVNDTFLGVPTESTMVEAHPKIKSTPYHGAFLAHLVVRPPAASQPSSANAAGGNPLRAHAEPAAAQAALPHPVGTLPIVPLLPHLAVSYQFTVRNGCSVEVTSTAPDTVDVFIAFGHGTSSPPLPPRQERTWSKGELAALNNDAAKAFLGAELLSGIAQVVNPVHGSVIGAAVVETILGRGIKTDEYNTAPVRDVNLLDRSHMTSVAASQLPGTQGIVTDDNQPYPVLGWLEVSWAAPQNRV